MPKIPVWGWIAIAIGAILLLRPRVAVGQGQVVPGGSLNQVDMGSHQVQKVQGSTATVTIGWTGETKSFTGAGITWSYRLRFEIYQGTFDLLSMVFGQQTAPYLVAQSSFLNVTIPASAPLGLYDIIAYLQAEGSDATGKGNGTWSDIRTLNHVSAMNVVAAAGAAVPAGSIGSVDVSQAIVRAAQGFLQI
mgnify:CR=1 FL=1